MAFRERTVTGYVIDADGTPVQNGVVSFQLDQPLGYTSTHIVINRVFTATTDSLGSFSVTLWCEEDSLLALNYTVNFPIANSGQPQSSHSAKISLAYQDGSPKDIGTLIAESQPPPTTVPEAIWRQLVDQQIAAAVLDALFDVQIASPANGQVLAFDSASGKWKNQAASGGGTIDGSGAAGRIAFWSDADTVGSSSHLTWDDANRYIVLNGAAAYLGGLSITVGGAGHFGFTSEALSWSYGLGYGVAVNNKHSSSGRQYVTNLATAIPLSVKGASGQTADLFALYDSADTLLSSFDKTGALKPASMANSAAPNNSVFYSTTVSKLVYKDSSGATHSLH